MFLLMQTKNVPTNICHISALGAVTSTCRIRSNNWELSSVDTELRYKLLHGPGPGGISGWLFELYKVVKKWDSWVSSEAQRQRCLCTLTSVVPSAWSLQFCTFSLKCHKSGFPNSLWHFPLVSPLLKFRSYCPHNLVPAKPWCWCSHEFSREVTAASIRNTWLRFSLGRFQFTQKRNKKSSTVDNSQLYIWQVLSMATCAEA